MLTKFVVVAALMVAAAPGADSAPKSTSFATKTAYWDQRPTAYLDPTTLFWKIESEVEKLQLKLVQVQQVNRHGTRCAIIFESELAVWLELTNSDGVRYPTDGNMGEIQDLLNKLQANYSDVIPQWLQNYSLPYNESDQGELSDAGAAELAAFGTRSRSALGSAIPSTFNASKFIVQHTYKSRTADSAKAYVTFRSPTARLSR